MKSMKAQSNLLQCPRCKRRNCRKLIDFLVPDSAGLNYWHVEWCCTCKAAYERQREQSHRAKQGESRRAIRTRQGRRKRKAKQRRTPGTTQAIRLPQTSLGKGTTRTTQDTLKAIDTIDMVEKKGRKGDRGHPYNRSS